MHGQLIGIPKRKNERLFILAGEKHDRVLEPRIATEVRQYTLAEKRHALFRRDAGRRDRGDTHEHAASLAREAVVDELHSKPQGRTPTRVPGSRSCTVLRPSCTSGTS